MLYILFLLFPCGLQNIYKREKLMEYRTTLSADSQNRPLVITIGNFDGLHRGHQFLLHELRQQAEALDSIPVMLTFSPHPLQVVRPDLHLLTLSTLDEKLRLAREISGITESIVITFTSEIVAMSAQQFLDELCALFPIKGIVLGENSRLGKSRESDARYAQEYGQSHGIAVKIVPLQKEQNISISSTEIRARVNEGNITQANELSGHPIRISGQVEHGEKRGRVLGFPTANLHTDPDRLYPAEGIYAVYAYVQDDDASASKRPPQIYQGAAYVGTNPTFNGTERRLEVHLLDTSLDLYGKHLVVDFIARVREDRRFSNVEDMQKQIFSHDIPQTRAILAGQA